MVRLHDLVAQVLSRAARDAGGRRGARVRRVARPRRRDVPRSSTSATRRRAGKRCRATSRRRRCRSSWPSAPGSFAAARTARHFDTFVNRVVYALTSPMGEVIGFGGRVINAEDQPKYKNSPETLLFKKGENLFGLHLAKHAIRKRRARARRRGQLRRHDAAPGRRRLRGGAAGHGHDRRAGQAAQALRARSGAHARRRSGRARGDDEGGAPVRRGRAAAAASRSCAPGTARSRIPTSWRATICRKLQALIDDAQDARRVLLRAGGRRRRQPTVPGRVAAIEEVRAALALAARSAGARPLLRQAGARCSRSTRAWCSARCGRRRRRQPPAARRGSRPPRRAGRCRAGARKWRSDGISARRTTRCWPSWRSTPTYWPRVDAAILKDDAGASVGCLGAGEP